MEHIEKLYKELQERLAYLEELHDQRVKENKHVHSTNARINECRLTLVRVQQILLDNLPKK